jgi:hypothetical protein
MLGESQIWDTKFGHEFRGTRTREWLRWRVATAIVNDRFILSSERMLHKDCNRKCSVKKNAGRESQEAWLQKELPGGKPSVVK